MEYGLIGEKLGHSYSKIIQEKLLDEYTYELCPLKKEELDGFMKAKTFKAINVTIPYKQEVIKYLHTMDDASKAIGAVNTIVNEDGLLCGYNTDYHGFLYTLNKHAIAIKNKKVLVLGNGGAAQAIIAVLKDLHAKEIIISARTIKENVLSLEEVYTKHFDVDVIVNTTPVGMYPNNEHTPISLTSFTKCKTCIDIIYNPLQTRLLIEAKKQGMQVVGGLEMLVAQAKYALEHFKQIQLEENTIDTIYKELKETTQNIVCIGMPGCGKTTIAKKVAKLSGKTFVDIDALIVEYIQMDIAQYFKQYGEAKFREIEKEITHKISKQTNQVISCGGGIVKDSDNIDTLKQNGVVVLLERDLELLVSGPSRPLSATKEAVTTLYQERAHLYEEAKDFAIRNDAPVSVIAKRVLEAYKQYNI